MVDRLDADAIPQQVCSNSYSALHKMVAKALFRCGWVKWVGCVQGEAGQALTALVPSRITLERQGRHRRCKTTTLSILVFPLGLP